MYRPTRRLLFLITIVSLLFAPALSAAASPVSTTGETPDVRLLRSDEQAAIFDVTAPRYQVQRNAASAAAAACQTLQMPGYVLNAEPGKPQLPVKVVLLGVPADAEIALEATSLTAPTRGVAGAICPAETPVPSAAEGDEPAQGATTEVVPDPAVYASNRLFPSAIARVVDLGFARSQRIVRVEISPIQINPVTGALVQHHDIRIALRFNGAAQTVEPVVESAEFEASLKSVLLNYDDARAWRSQPAQVATAAAWTPPQPAYKVSVKAADLYQVGRSALAAAGLPVNKLDPRTLRLFNAGQEVAIRVTGENDGLLDEGDLVLFYGQGVDTRYTDTNVYWLTYGGSAGLRMTDQPSLAGGTVASTHAATVHVETNVNYVSTVPFEPGYDHWYGPRIQALGATTAQRDFSFVVNGPASGDLSATLETQLASIMDGAHHLRLSVNGQQVQDTNWSDRALFKTSVTFPQTLLHEGNNTVRVALINDTPGRPIDIIYTDWLNIRYQRTYAVTGDRLPFGGDAAGAWEYRLTGFTSADIEAYNVTDPLHPARITGAVVTPAAGSHNLAFGDNSPSARQYLALTSAQRQTPVKIEADTPSSLQAGAGADYLIISHRDFLQAMQPLAAHRAAQGKRVRVVDVQDVYDEFGYGMMSAEAIHDFIAYTYANWPGPAPRDVTLVGDGTYDLRGYLPTSAPTYLPPYLEMVDLYVGETATDNRYVTVHGADILPDLNIGRLPANTAAEATAMVDKILAYEKAAPDPAWQHNVLFVADNLKEGGGDFYALSDGVADGYADPPTNAVKFLPQPYAATKVYLGQTCPDEDPSVACRQQIINNLNSSGALLVSYIGHGTKTQWAKERLLDLAAISGLNNAAKLPVMLPMTCDEGYFHEAQAGFESSSEASVRQPATGAIASWSPTGYGLSSGHDFLEKGLFLAFFHNDVRSLGAATTAAKLYLSANAPPGRFEDLIDTFLLLGDAGLRVQLVDTGPSPVYLPLISR